MASQHHVPSTIHYFPNMQQDTPTSCLHEPLHFRPKEKSDQINKAPTPTMPQPQHTFTKPPPYTRSEAKDIKDRRRRLTISGKNENSFLPRPLVTALMRAHQAAKAQTPNQIPTKEQNSEHPIVLNCHKELQELGNGDTFLFPKSHVI